MIFQCPQCSVFYEEEDGWEYPECIVGGHWTPHSEFDRIPTLCGVPLKCCHINQKRHHGILIAEQGCSRDVELAGRVAV